MHESGRRLHHRANRGLEGLGINLELGVMLRASSILNLMARECPGDLQSGSWVLDVGCGNGYLARRLGHRGARVVALDLSCRRVSEASATWGGDSRAPRFLVGNAMRIPMASGRFHLVTCCDVIEHIWDDATVISEAARMLGPGGVLAVTTVADRHENAEFVDNGERGGHVRIGYSLSRLVEMLEGKGLCVRRASFFKRSSLSLALLRLSRAHALLRLLVGPLLFFPFIRLADSLAGDREGLSIMVLAQRAQPSGDTR
jgi:2-polyprenyl-3-methyl-5-hydroxy-6-metoxy-1,4-benzoquinol methylase